MNATSTFTLVGVGGTALRLQVGFTDLFRVDPEGNLTLNYVKVRCIADINLDTLTGTGHLQRLEA